MNDNYLWDRSGEADPEVQQLEEILGTLRYQPRPLQIPDSVQVGRRRTYFPSLAIAAAIALLAVGLGLWFNFTRHQASPEQAKLTTPSNEPRPGVTPDKPAVAVDRDQNPTPPPSRDLRNGPSRYVQVGYRPRPSRNIMREPELSPQELAEKEQVLVALRLVSAKLSFARRKTQGEPPPNTIRNQHRIG